MVKAYCPARTMSTESRIMQYVPAPARLSVRLVPLNRKGPAMSPFPRRLALLSLAAFAFALTQPLFAAEPTKRILFFTRSAGYEHSVVKVSGDKPCYAETILRPLCEKNGWELTVTKDGSVFTPENIAKYDAFAFYTTGDLTGPAKDGSNPMSKEGKAALLQAIHDGKGWIGFHCASDTFHTNSDRYHLDPVEKRDPYINVIGGEFIHHGAQQSTTQQLVDPKFPGLENLQSFDKTEEWYSLKNFADNDHVILVNETKNMKGNMYQRPAYPSTWARMEGTGRVFYTSMGHREDVWTSPQFQTVITAGFRWILHETDADVTPNISAVAPEANTIPPSPEPKK
ncbi:MAG: ThuA domain-containing protein [Planctomycetes bacterium]|nr:ThuA domain-containing protein [Planctomycetota bacterium]